MPDQQIFVNKALEFLEDNTFSDGLKRNKKLEIIQKGLESDDNFSVYTLDRILAICIHNLKDSVNQSTVICLQIIATISKRVQVFIYYYYYIGIMYMYYNFTFCF